MKNIIVFDSQTSEKKEYELSSSANTFGALKSEIGLTFDNKKVVVKETRVTLENDDAVLPEGDITLYLFQKQSKHGNDDIAYIKKTVRRIKRMVEDIHDVMVEGISKEDVSSTETIIEETTTQEDEEIDAMAKEAAELKSLMGL
jgi:hypothetical protein